MRLDTSRNEIVFDLVRDVIAYKTAPWGASELRKHGLVFPAYRNPFTICVLLRWVN